MMLLGGPLVLRAAAYTAGTVAALSMTAACAPDEKFLKWGGPLSLCLGGVMVAAIGKELSPNFDPCSNFGLIRNYNVRKVIVLISGMRHAQGFP